MCKFVFPLHHSSTTDMYQNSFGEFPLKSIQKEESYEFCLTEEKSGQFTLERVNKEKSSKFKHLNILCPHHCQHKLTTTDNHHFICTECDPRLAR